MKIAKHELPADRVVYKLKDPFTARVVAMEDLTPESADDVQHIVLDISGSNLRHLEGQSIGVLPPGEQANGKPHKLRLYSVASPRNGERNETDRLAICVKRLVEEREDGSVYNGIASTHLCDLKVGDEVRITGPVGPSFVLPQDDSMDLVLIATGTGIAPFRAFLQYMYRNNGPGWKGEVRLFFGAKTGKELLYMNPANSDLVALDGDASFRAVTARSREEQNEAGSRMYVQHRIAEEQADLKQIFERDHFCIYICGLKGMESGIEDTFVEIAREMNREWADWKADLKKSGRWNIEVY